MTPPRPVADILNRIRELADDHYSRMPVLITTNRRGRYESGWIINSQQLTPLGHKAMPLADRQRHEQELADCIVEYAAHRKADPGRFTRNLLFPQSIELRLTRLPLDALPANPRR